VVDDRQTGETILDEALKIMKAQEEVERMGVNAWINLMSGQFSSCGMPPSLVPHIFANATPTNTLLHQAKHGTPLK
jgi:hypothetical protein